MMAVSGSLHLSHELGICKNDGHTKRLKSLMGKGKSRLLSVTLSSHASRQDSWSIHLSDSIYRPIYLIPNRCNVFKCNYFLVPSKAYEIPVIKTATTALMRSCNALQDSPLVLKLVPAVGIIVFAVWGLGPLMRQTRTLFFQKSDNSWRKSGTHYVTTSYIQPLLLWTGATLICRYECRMWVICLSVLSFAAQILRYRYSTKKDPKSRALDPIILPTEASQIVKQRLLNFVRSLSTVLAFAYCLSSLIQQAQKFFMETNDSSDTRNMGFQFAGKAVYTAVWVAAVSLFMELLGFSTQKWLTAGGLGTVLLTLAGREIFTNFLSSAMIHATRPFVVNEWIQTKIEGYEVSGTVEHVGWWSPTIVRGEDREAVHIPNHKFTVNVVRNLSQKTHWRIKTHLAISHLDVNKINNIVADMRKVLAKNPQVEQQRLHRRVFLDNINPENQALSILISCFVKTSHFEEYLCVKEAILLDLLRVISHHRARLATPIRTVQKIYSDADLENIPFADSAFARGGVAPNRPLLLIEPPYRINGEDKNKAQTRSGRANGEQDSKVPPRPTTDTKADAKAGATPVTDSKARETIASDKKENVKAGEMPNTDKKDPKGVVASPTDPKMGDKVMVKSASKSGLKTDSKVAEMSSSETRTQGTMSDNSTQNVSDSNQPKKAGVGNARHNSPAPSSDTASEKSGGFAASPQSKQEDERSTSRPALEENIVLGVALEGSKRTLPIEEGTAPTSTAPEKELAAFRNSNESLATEKDKKDNQIPTVPSKTPGDQ